MEPDNPLLQMADAERAEWIDLIANCGNGERMAFNQVEGLEQHHIDEVMADAEYERCCRCDWWMEVHTIHQIDDQSVCEDCLTDEEREAAE